jgi:predicted deacylase
MPRWQFLIQIVIVIFLLLKRGEAMSKLSRTNVDVTTRPDGSKIQIPIVDVGSGEKRAFIGVSIHGDELTGQASVWSLIDLLKNVETNGSVRIATVMNPDGVNYDQRGIPFKEADVNRLYPGDPEGSVGERIAAKVWSLAQEYECIFDVHTAGECIPFIIVDPIPDGELSEQTLQLAKSAGVTVLGEFPQEKYMRRHLTGSLSAFSVQNGKVGLTLELAGSDGIDWITARSGFAALVNMLVKLGVLGVEHTRRRESVKLFEDSEYHRDSLRTEVPGIIQYKVAPGYMVKNGDTVAQIRNFFGDVIGEVKAEYDCYIVGINRANAVFQGDSICTVAVK